MKIAFLKFSESPRILFTEGTKAYLGPPQTFKKKAKKNPSYLSEKVFKTI